MSTMSDTLLCFSLSVYLSLTSVLRIPPFDCLVPLRFMLFPRRFLFARRIRVVKLGAERSFY